MHVNLGNQGQLQSKRLQALLRMVRKNNRGSPDTPIRFMDHIEAVFEDEGMLKLRSNSEHQLVIIDGCKTARMNHQQWLEIGNSFPAIQSDKAMILKGYDSWLFYQGVNQPLYESEFCQRIECRPIDDRLRS